MWAVYKLRARTYFRSPAAFMLIFISVIYMIIFGTLVSTSIADLNLSEEMQEVAGARAMANAFGIILTMLVMASASYQFGFEFIDMKKSVLLRRIGASKVSKTAVVGSFILWALTTLLMVVIWVFILLAIFSEVFTLLPAINWKEINWLGLFAGIVFGAIGSYVIAFLFVSIVNDTDTYNICNTFFFFFATAWGGLFGGGSHWMYVIGHITPIGWTADLIQGAMNGDPVFHFGGYIANMTAPANKVYEEWGINYNYTIPGTTEIAIYVKSWRAIFDVFAPLIIGTIAGGASLKKFKWD